MCAITAPVVLDHARKKWGLVAGLATVGTIGVAAFIWYWSPELLGLAPRLTPTGEPVKPPLPNPLDIGKRIKNRFNANGAHADLQKALDEWELNGPFPVRINSGVRTTAQQLRLWQRGRDAAGNVIDPKKVVAYGKTAEDTSHGRGGAIDLSPIPDTAQNYIIMGEWFEARGFTWGGRWLRQFPPENFPPNGGEPWHVEMKNWKTLPMPSGVSGFGLLEARHLNGRRGLYGF